MKKLFASLLLLSFLFCAVSASAQMVNCPSAGVILTLPDTFTEVPRTPMDDPNLVLQFTDGAVNLTVYVSYGGANNAFMVLTGDELEYGPVMVNGAQMQYARGLDEYGSWITYSWMRAQDAVQLYFVWTGNDDAALSLINEIITTITFT